MSLAGTTIYMHQFGQGATLRQRLKMRKTCGPYEWTVPTVGSKNEGRGYYASDDIGNVENRDSTFRLRACDRNAQRPAWRAYTPDGGFTYFAPVVLRLPRGRGFLAGNTMGKSMSSGVGLTIYADEADAWRAADDDACNTCEREMEYLANAETEDA